MAKKGLSDFVRFGSLNLKSQKGYGKKGFHSPPTSKGFYAFPYKAQEMFLVGSIESFQPDQFPKAPKYKEPNERTDKECEEWEGFDWESHNKKVQKIKKGVRREFKKTKGNIWHHLGEYTSNSEIIKRHNSWVKTSIIAWKKAFKKCCVIQKAESIKIFEKKSINEVGGLNGVYSKDHFEVFFDEKV